MSAPKTHPQDEITVLVFKDNYAARTFQISLAWISRLGVLGGAMIGLTLVSGYFAIKYYRTARHADPARVQELEQELTDLRASYQSLEAKKLTVAPMPSEGAQVAQVSTTVAPSSAPVPTVTVTVTATPAAASAPTASRPVLLFSALPASNQMSREAPAPISIDTPRFTWNGKILRAKFTIQYVKEDHGSQSGRIVLLARGPDILLSHPANIFRKAGSDSLIAPEQGEYFSVSRFREVKTDFGPIRSTSAIKELEILLLNPQGQILLHQVAPVQISTPQKAAPAPAAPSESSEQEPAAPAEAPKP